MCVKELRRPLILAAFIAFSLAGGSAQASLNIGLRSRADGRTANLHGFSLTDLSSAAATGIYNDAYTDLSATLRYDLTKNVSLGLEANNILDEKQRTYDGAEEGLRTNVFFGRLYKASVSVNTFETLWIENGVSLSPPAATFPSASIGVTLQ